MVIERTDDAFAASHNRCIGEEKAPSSLRASCCPNICTPQGHCSTALTSLKRESRMPPRNLLMLLCLLVQAPRDPPDQLAPLDQQAQVHSVTSRLTAVTCCQVDSARLMYT